MALTLSGTNGVVGAGFTVDASGVSVTAGVGTFSSVQGSGASLTQIPAANIVGVCTSGLTKTGGFGKILQVKQAILNTGTFTTSSTSFVDITGLSVSITPSSASNKVLVIMSGGEFGMYSSGAYTAVVQILRDSTALLGGNRVTSREGSGNAAANCSFTILDSPSSTSSITYKGQCKSDDGSKTVYVVNSNNGNISLTLMEVEA